MMPSRMPAGRITGVTTNVISGTILLLSALSFPVITQPALAAEPVNFAPHRAVYDLTLSRSTAGSGVAQMNGRMVYELTGSACEGFTQNMRFVTSSATESGAETVTDLRTSSWEETNGKRLRFNSSQYQNDTLAETSQGDAGRAKDGSARVDLSKPASASVPLPPDINFPMQHAERLLQAAQSGVTELKADLYDGAEKGNKYYVTNAFIGRRIDPGVRKMPASLESGAKLDALPSWPIAISYFEPDSEKKDSAPTYELNFRYYLNGVTTGLKIDYGDFALNGELAELTFLPVSKCEATAH